MRTRVHPVANAVDLLPGWRQVLPPRIWAPLAQSSSEFFALLRSEASSLVPFVPVIGLTGQEESLVITVS